MTNQPSAEPSFQPRFTVVTLLTSVGISLGVYILALGIGFWFERTYAPSGFHGELTILLAIAAPLAMSSLIALWWSCSRLPSYSRTLISATICVLCWALLIGLLPNVDLSSPIAACWGLSLLTQVALTAFGATLVQRVTAPAERHAPSRFSLAFLFLWTAVVAAMLGGGRWIASFAGWTTADILGWEYLLQLEVLAASSAVLSTALFAAVRLRVAGLMKALICLALTLAIPAAVPWIMASAVGSVGATHTAVFVLLGVQGLIVLAALLPLRAR
jgi:hypothetical protein